MTSADPRPRIVEVAFWSWLVAAVSLIVGGLLAVTTGFATIRDRVAASVTDDQIHSFLNLYRGTGAIAIVAGMAVGYLAGRTRRGDKRFHRASVALSLALVVLLVACALLLGFILPLTPLAVLALIVAAVLATRGSASAWFDTVDSGGDGG